MGRQSLQPQEAYPLLLLLLFYNELLKPSFPSLPWAEGVRRWGLPSLEPDSHAQAPRVAALSRGGGIGRSKGAVCRLPSVCVCVFKTVLTADRWGQNGFCISVHPWHVHTCGHFQWCVSVCVCRCGLQSTASCMPEPPELLSVTLRRLMSWIMWGEAGGNTISCVWMGLVQVKVTTLPSSDRWGWLGTFSRGHFLRYVYYICVA